MFQLKTLIIKKLPTAQMMEEGEDSRRRGECRCVLVACLEGLFILEYTGITSVECLESGWREFDLSWL